MIVTILGCGGSGGVPMIGNDWGVCDPNNPRNKRLRASVLIQHEDTNILIDTSPDLREQLLNAQVQKLNAVFYTHAHADHCHGIDDLRPINFLMKSHIPIYGDAPTIEKLTTRFEYIFNLRTQDDGRYYKPALVPHVLNGPVQVNNLTVIPFEQDHTFVKSMGFRIGNFAYTTDAKNLNDEAFEILKGVDVWVVDAVSYKPHPTHSHVQQSVEWIARVGAKKAYLTHMGQGLDYATLCRELPEHIRPAYDGLQIETVP
jgi:phosphoribosyl 1,2-cyclic phosphate phosphodiesterase